MKRLAGWLGVCGAVGLVGCGGGDGNANGGDTSSGRFTTGLPAGTVLSTLTPSQVQSVCDSENRFLREGPVADDLMAIACQSAAAFGAAFTIGGQDQDALRQACRSNYDQCIAQGNTTQSSDCMPAGSLCAATIAELETCLNDLAAGFAATRASMQTCDTLTLPISLDPRPAAESCVTLQQKCPGVVPTTDGG